MVQLSIIIQTWIATSSLKPRVKGSGINSYAREDPGLSLLMSPGNPDKNGAPRPKMSVWSPDKLT